MIRNLREHVDLLRARGLLVEVDAEVDPRLEIAEIHRRVVARGGPALLFRRPRGSSFPVVTNLFGTAERVDLCFGSRPKALIERLVDAAHHALPPRPSTLWRLRGLAWSALKVGMKNVRRGPVLEVEEAPDFGRLPVITCWRSDGGPFLTFPLVYTEHPETGRHNLGVYRMQVRSPTQTGMHFQIHKGGGFHHHAAERRGEDLPATVFLGGPPALFLAAIAPLPEDAPELLLASLLLGERLRRVRGRARHPLVAEAEFAIVGRVLRGVRRPEGPFGDHYGYDSRVEDYPVFEAERVYRRADAIYPATVVGPPRQEDFPLGDYLQDLLSPLFPLVMPSVKDVWAFGETGFHSLAAARVKTQRYPREAIASGLRILGEGQLSLTKVLVVTDRDVNVRDWKVVLQTLLERIDWRTEAIVLGEVAQDSLDYTGPKTERGSKAILLAVGEPKRTLPDSFAGVLPPGVARARVHAPGCLVLEGVPYASEPEQASRVSRHDAFDRWPLLVLVDDLDEATRSTDAFLWVTFTRMEPAADLHGRERVTSRFHTGLVAPVTIDARMKPWYPAVMRVDDETRALVDRRWSEYRLE